MKFARVMSHGAPAIALHAGEAWVNLSDAYHEYLEVLEAIDGQTIRGIEELMARGLFNAEFVRKIEEFLRKPGVLGDHLLAEPLAYLQPLRPGKIIAIGRNYHAHAKELGHDAPDEPIFFAKSPSVCIGPDTPIAVPDWAGRVDHEGELAVVIGRAARNVSEEEARACIAGYTLVNDVTARELQKADIAQGLPWYRSKNFDTFCPLGPAIVLPEALGWPVEAELTVRVNGGVRQQGNTRNFIFGLPRLIAHVSRYLSLEAGDIIATGTPEGVGPIAPGDTVEVCVPEIGVLRNPVARA